MRRGGEFEVRELTRQECLDHLGRASVGRVGVSVDALPVILPVHFSLFGDSVLFRTSPGTKLDAATIGAVVAFQADSYDHADGTGWSVLVQGIASLSAGGERHAEASTVPIRTWPGVHPDFSLVRLDTTLIGGRSFRYPPFAP